MAVRDSGRPYAVNLSRRMKGLENKLEVVIVPDGQVGRWKQWKKVISGECIACFVDPLYLSDALQTGLRVLKVPDLQVVGTLRPAMYIGVRSKKLHSLAELCEGSRSCPLLGET
jgi:hypothetical protein